MQALFSSTPSIPSVIFITALPVVSAKKHDAVLNLVLSSPLSQLCIWPSPHWWPDNQKAKERGSREREDSGPTTKIGQFSRESWMSGRHSTGCQLFWKDECHDWWENLSGLGSTTTSWAQLYWCGRAQLLQESRWWFWRRLVLHHWLWKGLGALLCSKVCANKVKDAWLLRW